MHVCGSQHADIRYEGLIDASDIEDYDVKFQVLRKKWDSSKEALSFLDWVEKYKSESVKHCMVRISAGLGSPPSQFTTTQPKI